MGGVHAAEGEVRRLGVGLSPSAWGWGLIAGGAAVFIEQWFRFHPNERWGLDTPWVIPLALLINFSVVQILRSASILQMAIIFGFFSGTLRIAAVLWRGDHVHPGAWLGFGFLLAATAVSVAWR